MTDAEKLLALAARCDAASGPDRRLDGDIWLAIGLGPTLAQREGPFAYKRDDANDAGVWRAAQFNRPAPDRVMLAPAYTSSLDAAMSAVPDGLYPTIDFVAYRCWLRDRRGFDPSSGPAYGFGVSVPRVVVAACLRARARGEG